MDMYFEKPLQITITGHPKNSQTSAFVQSLSSYFLPNKIITYADNGEGQSFLCDLGVDYVSRQDMKVEGQVVAQICQNQSCKIAKNVTELVALISPTYPQQSYL